MSLRPAKISNEVHPISDFQQYMIDLALETEPNSFANQEKTIRLATRIRPACSLRSLQRAFKKLVERHDSLRLRFVELAGEWRAEIRPQHPDGLLFEDLSDLTPEEQDKIIVERSLQPLTALSDTLFEMRLLRCGPSGDVLLTRLNHAIGDGYSVAILVEDLLRFLLPTPFLKKAPGHADFIRHRNRALADRVEEKARYWEDLLLPLPEDLNIGRRSKGLAKHSSVTIGKTRRMDGILTPALANHVVKLASAAGVSNYCVLHAAFSETLCDLGKADQVLVKSPLSRHDAEISDFVGADIQAVLVKYERDPNDLLGRALWVSEQIANGIAHTPTTAFDDGGLIDQSYKDANMARSRFLVHVEVPKGRFKSSPFNIDKSMSGKASIGPYALEPIQLTREVETNYELTFLIDDFGTTPMASLIANAEGYDQDDLKSIAKGIQKRLRECGV